MYLKRSAVLPGRPKSPGKTWAAALCDSSLAPAQNDTHVAFIHTRLTAIVASPIVAVVNATAVYPSYLPLIHKLKRVQRGASWGDLVCTTFRWRQWAKVVHKIASLTSHKVANEAERKHILKK